MLKKCAAVCAFLLCASAALAQTNLTSAVCPGSGCVQFSTTGMGTLGVQIKGTFSGTYQFEQTSDNAPDATWYALTMYAAGSTTGVTSGTGVGMFTGTVAGARFARVRVSSYSSGTVVVAPAAVTQAKLGFFPPFNGDDSTFLDGTGAFSTPAGGGGGMGVPAGATKTVQYNAGSGNFGAVAINSTSTVKYLQQVSSGTAAFVAPQSSDLSDVAALGLVATPLSQFAATTSAQLAGVLSDESGTGKAVFNVSPLFTTPTFAGAGAGVATLQYANSATSRTITMPDPGAADTLAMLAATQTLTNKTLTTPTIGDFTNATHNHQNTAGGGKITEAAFNLSGTSSQCVLGDGTIGTCPGAGYTNLFQNGSNGLFQRNSTTAQTFDLAGTYTSTTDFKSLQFTYGTDADSNVGMMIRNNKGSSTSTYPNVLIRAQGAADLIIAEETGSNTRSIKMLTSVNNIALCPNISSCFTIEQQSGLISLGASTGAMQLFPTTVFASIISARAADVFTCVGCGSSPTLLGGNLAGRVTIGTTPSAALVLTMPIPWTSNNAACWAVDETTGVVVPAVASGTATLTITGTFLVTQTVAFGCLAIQ